MFIDRKYDIAAATAEDATRPVLQQVLVERNPQQPDVGVAVAADGFMVAVVPVRLEEDDVVGLVPAVAFRDARGVRRAKHRGNKGDCAIRLTLWDQYVAGENGHCYPRVPQVTWLSRFPNWKALVDVMPYWGRLGYRVGVELEASCPQTTGLLGVSLDVELLQRLSRALGTPWLSLMDSRQRKNGQLEGALVVLTDVEDGDGDGCSPPWGLLMPMWKPKPWSREVNRQEWSGGAAVTVANKSTGIVVGQHEPRPVLQEEA